MSAARISSLTNISARPTAPALVLLLAITLSGLLVLPRLAPVVPTDAPVALAVPLIFTERAGALAEPTIVQAGTIGASFTFSPEGVSLATLGGARLQIAFPGANPHTTIRAVEPQSAVVSSYQGNDPAGWSEGAPTYGAVVYDELFPGISLHLTGDTRQLKGTYTVDPHADPSPIAWHYPGASELRIDPASGDLQIAVDGQTLVERAPVAWQDTPNGRVMVDVRFALAGETAGFSLGAYNPALPLVIDPELVYSSYLGGNSDEESHGIARDVQGNLYLIGRTYSTDFGGRTNTIAGSDDVFVAKFDPTGKRLLYRTILGGRDGDTGIGIAVNGTGEVAITVNTSSIDFPLVDPLLDTRTFYGGAFAKLDAAGRLVFSSYIDASFSNSRQNIAFDKDGNMVFTGLAWSEERMNDVGVFIFKGDGSTPVAQGSFGGSGQDYGISLALGPDGNLYLAGKTRGDDTRFPLSDNAFQKVCGAKSFGTDRPYCDEDAFVAIVSSDASRLLAATYLGGAGTDDVVGIGVDGGGNVYVAGSTAAQNFPTKNAFQPTWLGADNFSNGFLTKLTPDLSAAVYSTFLSSQDQSGSEYIYALAVDAAGNAAVTGLTNGTSFPVKQAVEGELDGRFCRTTSERYCHDAFVTAFNPNGGLTWSTYLGGDDDDQGRAIAFDGAGGVWVTGQTEASDFATTAGAQTNLRLSDVFLTRLGTAPTPGPGTDKPFKVALPLINR